VIRAIVTPRRIVLALLLAALVLATIPRCPRNWETWPTVPAAAMVRRQILDARGGTP
jgi:hypothetical protein